jgi:hypothetical protein
MAGLLLGQFSSINMDKPNHAKKQPAQSAKSAHNRDKGKEGKRIMVTPYPGARALPGEKGPRGVDITEWATADEWRAVLKFYEKELTAQGWLLFADNYLADRGTLSFRRADTETITVLAAQEDEATHIRIYIQQK